jgi:hypothetical protein
MRMDLWTRKHLAPLPYATLGGPGSICETPSVGGRAGSLARVGLGRCGVEVYLARRVLPHRGSSVGRVC